MSQANPTEDAKPPALDPDLTKVRRHPERGSHDRETIYQILDEGLLCHVGLVEQDPSGESVPVVIPMGYGRWHDELVLHGSPGSRLMKGLAEGRPVCVTVTHVDGLVLARSAFHSSMNYRSVVVFGRGRGITDPAEKRQALYAVTENLLPGRTSEARPMTDKEVAGTAVVAISLDRASAKVRSGPPSEPETDQSFPVWAGVVPMKTAYGEPEPAPDLAPGLEPNPDFLRLRQRQASGPQ